MDFLGILSPAYVSLSCLYGVVPNLLFIVSSKSFFPSLTLVPVMQTLLDSLLAKTSGGP